VAWKKNEVGDRKERICDLRPNVYYLVGVEEILHVFLTGQARRHTGTADCRFLRVKEYRVKF